MENKDRKQYIFTIEGNANLGNITALYTEAEVEKLHQEYARKGFNDTKWELNSGVGSQLYGK